LAGGAVFDAAVGSVVLRFGTRRRQAGGERVGVVELVELLRFVKAPGGVRLFWVGPALGARLHSYFDGAL
jgi:hypothetical protein